MIKELTISDFIKDNKTNLNQELIDFLSIPSVSTDSTKHKHVRSAADFVRKSLKNAGADEVEIIETDGLPVVFGEKTISSSYPTLLIYGHYDVQPADSLELWESDPFTPIIKEDKIFARGACDDKAQMMIPIKAFEFLNKQEAQKFNLKFLFEGEEEVGSISLNKFINENKEKLNADCSLIIDTFLFDKSTPAIVYGTKGAIMMDLAIQGPEKDMHSGLYGGLVKNPIDEISRIISSFKDKEGKVLINGFYQGITPPSSTDLKHLSNWASVSNKDPDILKIQAYTPTLEFNGIQSGYNGEGAKTIIPAYATTKLSIRTVAGQNPDQIVQNIKNHLEREVQDKHFTISLKHKISCSAAVMSTEQKIFNLAEKAYSHCFQNKVIYQRMGGSIPVVGFFQNELNLTSVLMGFGLESDNIHAPNEHYHLSNYYKGIETIANFLKLEL